MSDIHLKVMCVIKHGDAILASQGYDSAKKQRFYRLLGGTLEFGETIEAGIRRELREELNSEIDDLKFLQIVESFFTYEGRDCHEITFLFSSNLARKELYSQDIVHIIEPSRQFEAEWVSVKDVVGGHVIVYPELDYSIYF